MRTNFAATRRSVGCAGSILACVVAASLSLSPWICAIAQETEPGQTVQLPAISVTVPPPSKPTNQAASNSVVVSPTTVPTPTEQSASSVTVMTGADLERQQIRTIPDALETVPGLNVVQTGGPGGQTSVFMRGTNSNHVKVLVDGIDVGDPTTPNGAFDFGHLLTGDIERIEVLRGPQSGLYGSDAIGGVISITTKKGEGPPKVTATAEGGSFGTFNQTAGLSGSQENFNYAFNILHFRSTDTPVTPLDLLAPGEHRNNDNYDNWTYSTKLGANLSDNLAVNLVGRYTDATLGFTGDTPNLFPSIPEALQSTQVRHQFFGRGEAVWSLFDGRFKNFFGVNYSNEWSWNFDPNPDSGYTSPLVLPPTTNLGQRVKYDWRGEAQVAPGQTLVLGLEDQTETLRTDSNGTVDMLGNFTPMTITADRQTEAGWIELQSEFAKRFFVVSNFRYDANDVYGDHETWRVAPVYLVPGTETKLKASYGTGFKAPTLSQLFVNEPQFGFVANPNLKPEESNGWDAGFEQPIASNRFRFGATYFRNDIKNLIDFVFSPTFTNVNIGMASMYGAETFAAWAVTTRLNLRADYTYTVAKDDTTGDELHRRPKNKASLTAAWRATDRLSLSSTVIYVGSWVDDSRDGSVLNVKAPGYAVVNLAANYAVNDNVTVFGRINNLFNKQYEDPLGFLRPGFGIFGGIRVTAGGLPSHGTLPSGAPSVAAAPPSPSPRSSGVM